MPSTNVYTPAEKLTPPKDVELNQIVENRCFKTGNYSTLKTFDKHPNLFYFIGVNFRQRLPVQAHLNWTNEEVVWTLLTKFPRKKFIYSLLGLESKCKGLTSIKIRPI